MKVEDGVWRYLDVSWSHVTPDDIALLEREELPLVVMAFDEGFWVSTFDIDEDDLFSAGASRYLINVLVRAAELDCFWVKLDRDGNEFEDLAIYNW